MPQYYRNSGLAWPQYLKAQAFADDIKDVIRRAGKAMSSKIDEQTDDIVASNEALGESISAGLDQLDSTLQSGFDQVNETVRNGFERMEYGLNNIACGIAGLRSDFNWAMSGFLHKLDIQNLLLKDIYVELCIPDFQKERRYYVEQGCKHYTNGLYQESLDNFLKAEPLEKTDPFVLYSIGQIYLYQPDMIDMDKAQDYFLRAGKYYAAEKKNKQAGQSYFHAGIAAYLRRDDVNAPQFSKKASELYPELLEAFYNHAKFLAVQGNDSGLCALELAIRKDQNYALKAIADSDFAGISAQLQCLIGLIDKFAKEASGLHPELLEAIYNHAKFLAVQGNDSGLWALELAIRKDRNYALKVTADSEFASISTQLQGLLNKLKREAKAEAEKTIAALERELYEYVTVEEITKKKIANLLNQIKMKTLIANNTYFDYLDYISALGSLRIELCMRNFGLW